jgi:hypothetical protein
MSKFTMHIQYRDQPAHFPTRLRWKLHSIRIQPSGQPLLSLTDPRPALSYRAVAHAATAALARVSQHCLGRLFRPFPHGTLLCRISTVVSTRSSPYVTLLFISAP